MSEKYSSSSTTKLRGVDGDEADSMEESNMPQSERKVTDSSIRKLLNPLSRDQLINLLVKVGLQDESVLNEIKHASETDPSRTKLFVRELAWATTSEKLRSVFEQYGEIEEAVVIKDRQTQKSRGFGFVRFKTAASASRALQEPAKEIDGRTTQCNLASAGNPFKRQQPTGSPPRGPTWNLESGSVRNPSLNNTTGWHTHDSWIPAPHHELHTPPSHPSLSHLSQHPQHPRWSTTPRYGPRSSFPPGPGTYLYSTSSRGFEPTPTQPETSSTFTATTPGSGVSGGSGISEYGTNTKTTYSNPSMLTGYPGGRNNGGSTGPTGPQGSGSFTPTNTQTRTAPLSPSQQFQASYSQTYPTAGTQYNQPY